MENTSRAEDLLKRAEFLLEEVGDHKKSYEIAEHVLEMKEIEPQHRKRAQDIIDRIKIDPATWFMVAFVIMGIVIEVLLTK